MFQHDHCIARRQGHGAAGPPLADHTGDQRHSDVQTGFCRTSDGLRLAAFLGAHTRIGALSIHQGDDRQEKAVRQAHQSGRLAVALRPGHAEVMAHPALRIAALFMPDDHHRTAPKAADTARNSLVIRIGAVAGQGGESIDQPGHIILKLRPVWVPGHLYFLPWGQFAIGFA